MQKFILTNNGEIRLGDVNLHRHLLLPGERCLGGGYWQIDYTSMTLQLSGASMDYGRPQWDRFSTLLVPSGYAGMTVTYEGRNLAWDHTLEPV